MQYIDLINQDCSTNYRGARCCTQEELCELLAHLPRWETTTTHYDKDSVLTAQLCSEVQITKLVCSFKSDSYLQGLSFANAVAQLAEQQSHHPLLLIEYSKVTVVCWTHVLNGLHLNDFILAAKIDELYSSGQ